MRRGSEQPVQQSVSPRDDARPSQRAAAALASVRPSHRRRHGGVPMTIRDLATGFLAGALCAATLSASTGAHAAEKLRLGNEGIYPPFSMVDSAGKLTGVEPDLAREMCKRMNVECELIVMDFKALIPSLLQGKFDILVSQVTPTAERKQKLLFSRRIVANPMAFVVPASSNHVFTKE